MPAAGGPARVACRPLAPAFVRHLLRQGRLPGFASSRRPWQSFARLIGWILHGLVACQAPPGHCPARVVRRACPARPSPPLCAACQPPGSATSDHCPPGLACPPGCAPCFRPRPARQGPPSCFFRGCQLPGPNRSLLVSRQPARPSPPRPLPRCPAKESAARPSPNRQQGGARTIRDLCVGHLAR